MITTQSVGSGKTCVVPGRLTPNLAGINHIVDAAPDRVI
jgi:hypothetical protein